jgi:hypothetical protein
LRIALRVFLGSEHAAAHFRFQIFAQIFGNDSGRGKFTQVGNRKLGQEGEQNRDRRGRISD